MSRNTFEQVTKEKPCAICGKSDWCRRLVKYHLCMRVQSDRPLEKGGWLHQRNGDFSGVKVPPRKPAVSEEELDRKWRPVAERAHRAGYSELPRLADSLGVALAPLVELMVGHTMLDGSPCWTFPERSAAGHIIGITRRFASGKKLQYRGSRRGLTYAESSFRAPGPIWIAEGGSDVAAGLSLGMFVIGRPNNTGGAKMLADLLQARRRRIIVLGENDRKSDLYVRQSHPNHQDGCRGCDKCWPGLHGAREVARQLGRLLDRRIEWMLPPDGIKDLRDYLSRLSVLEWPRYASQIRRGKLPRPSQRSDGADS